MNGTNKEKAFRRPRRDKVCCSSAHRSGFLRLPQTVWPRSSSATGYCQADEREEQRADGRMRKVPFDEGVDVKRHRTASKARARSKRPDFGNSKGSKAEPCDLVRGHVDVTRLGAGNGYKARTIPARRVFKERPVSGGSEKNLLIPSGGAESGHIAPSDGVERVLLTPSDGAMCAVLSNPPTPSDGAYLDIAICIGIFGRPKPGRNIPEKGL